MMRILRAVEYCKLWHGEQRRKYTGEPYYLHPLEVAEILGSVHESENVVISGLLHDVVEDCGITFENISDQFGMYVSEVVREVTDVSKQSDGNRAERKQIDLEHLAKATYDGKTVKLADLISNTRSIVKHDPNFAAVYLKEKEALLTVLIGGNPFLYQMAYETLESAKRQLEQETPKASY